MEDLQVLLHGYIAGSLTDQDKKRLYLMLEDPAHAAQWQALIAEMYEMAASKPVAAVQDENLEEMIGYILRYETGERLASRGRIRQLYKRLAIAAAIALLLGTGGYMWMFRRAASPDPRVQTAEIAPGGNRATLTLSDGTVISLDSAGNGELARQGHTRITKLRNGQIAYEPAGDLGGDVIINKLFTPKGGQYQVVLPDGTNVWLNAMSSICYPAAFTGTTRKVSISGEVYFEVAQNSSKPFIVDIDGRSVIQVLGTSFNVNAYGNEENIKATLAAGSVKVTTPSGNLVLLPGQQAQIATDGRLALKDDADIEQVLAWKNGFFNFNGADLRTVMRQLERWYDIQVVFGSTPPTIHLTGKIRREMKLSNVLRILSEFNIKYELSGRTLTIQ